MLRNIGNQNFAPQQSVSDTRHSRNKKDDIKTSIDLLFKFTDELSLLHPDAIDFIHHILQAPRY